MSTDYDENTVSATSCFVAESTQAQRIADYYLANATPHAKYPHLVVKRAAIVGPADVDRYDPGFVNVELIYEPKPKGSVPSQPET